jgi:transcriptional regulator with XRE-family HTH domain
MITIDTGESTMFFSSERTKHEADAFKYRLVDLLHELKITQEELGRLLGVSQPAVAQWLNPKTDNHMPAFLLAALPDPPRAMLLRWMLRETETSVTERIPVIGELRGDMTEHLIAAQTMLGEIARNMRTNPSKCRMPIEALRHLCELMTAEIDHETTKR